MVENIVIDLKDDNNGIYFAGQILHGEETPKMSTVYNRSIRICLLLSLIL